MGGDESRSRISPYDDLFRGFLKYTGTGGSRDEPLNPLYFSRFAPTGLGRRRAAGADFRPFPFTPPPPTLEANSPPARPTGLTVADLDDTITLTWNQATDNAAYYQYQVNHNDTSTGRLSGWTEWANIPDSNGATVSHTFTGLAKGKEYRYKIRAVADAVQGLDPLPSPPAPGASPWYVSAILEPPAPTGLTATAGGRSVTLSWDAATVSSVTGYAYQVNHNATSTGNMSGWSDWAEIPNSDGSTTSHTFSGLADGKEYRYKLQAVGQTQTSDTAPGAAPWYVAAIPLLPAVGNLWVERVCDHYFKVKWERVPGTTGYDLNLSGNNRHGWQRLMTNKNYNAWKASWWEKDRTYWFAVRAVNANGTGEWRNVQSVAPPCAVEGLQAGYAANGEISVSWNPAKRADGYDVNFSADNGRSWQRMVSNTASTSATFTKDPGALPYNPNFLVAVQSRKGNLTGGWRNAPIALLVRLSAGNIGNTTATLTLTGHSGDWYVKKTTPTPAGNCSSAISGTTHNLSNLSFGTTYTYTAYSDSGCSTALDSVTFTGVSIGNLDETRILYWPVGNNGKSAANPFTTGSSAYTLSSIKFEVYGISGSPGDLTVSIYSNGTNNLPDSSQTTLTGSNPTSAGSVTYTCFHNCSLSANTKYHLVLAAVNSGSGNTYKITTTPSAQQAKVPTNNGWSLGTSNTRSSPEDPWDAATNYLKFKVTAVAK